MKGDNMNVMILDDNKEIVSGMVSGIDWEMLGIAHVYGVNSAQKAREILVSKQIDICLCDIEMPVEDGLSFVRWAREEEYDFECIFLTSHAVFDYAREAILLNVFEYVLQPAKYEKIEDVIRRAIKKRNMQKRNETLQKTDFYRNQLVNDVKTGENRRENAVSKSEKIIQFIHEHIGERITRADIASYMNYHEDSLTRIFKEETGYKLKEYINIEKINYAKILLDTTEKSIGEIAMESGFDNFSHFSQAFKKAEGISPAEHKHKHR
jgi:YesN/AraC family two-component response regulator